MQILVPTDVLVHGCKLHRTTHVPASVEAHDGSHLPQTCDPGCRLQPCVRARRIPSQTQGLVDAAHYTLRAALTHHVQQVSDAPERATYTQQECEFVATSVAELAPGARP